MAYERFPLKLEITIEHLYTFFFYELRKDYVFPGEQHDFWEFLYVDKGEIEIVTDLNAFTLKQGDMVFYSPNEFHSCRASSKHAPNVIIVSFESRSEAMSSFIGKSFTLTNAERAVLTKIVREASFSFDPSIHEWRRSPQIGRKEGAPYGSEQLIKNYLEILLVELIRRGEAFDRIDRTLSSLAKEKNRRELIERIVSFMNARLDGSFTIEELSAATQTGKSQLKASFKAATGLGIIEYFQQLKIERAKALIRESARNFTEIADSLGYSSIHYFSRQFKKATGTTPTEYARTVGARIVD